MKLPPTLTKKGLVLFLIFFCLFLTLLIINLLHNYSSDIFNKGLDYFIISKLIVLGVGTLWLESLAFATIITGAIIYRKLFNDNQDLKRLFRKDIIVVTLFSVCICFFAVFIQPSIKLRFMVLLYDIEMTAPGEKFERKVDISIFKESAISKNIFGIVAINDSLNNEIDNIKEQLKTNLKTNASPETLDSLFMNDKLSSLKITRLELKNHKAKRNGNNYTIQDIETPLILAKQAVNLINKKLTINKLMIWKMFFIPLSIILFFIMSVLIGIIGYKTNPITLIILLMFLIAPIWYYLSIYIDFLIKNESISISLGKLGLLSLLVLFNIVLYCIQIRKKLFLYRNN